MSYQVTFSSSDSDLKPKKYTNAGLRTHPAEAGVKKSSLTKALGGLSDKDVDDSDERPSSPVTKAPVQKVVYPKKLKCTGRRVNNVSTFSMIAGWSFSLIKLLYSS